ncbi:isocitrate lyase/PEP mutase family protein [Ktedonosporobacter rubrisoli]|uniref:Isocitrate lyase/PEP mutase family protein n=2 Tax=Ktedonosporobacter rubrisoli TaxID=2509675 RepID=A0A4P6K5D9_KTERU|nr:isocitrate lyase/PEP mutase family protein [Ktedonosporobacter rubrisoli]
MLEEPGLLLAPGAYDALSARLIAQAGFPLAYMTGFGTAASVLGQPDVGLVTMSEMVTRAAALTAVMGKRPLIADADTGYGSPLNVRRTVREYERAGVAALHLEDQAWPKKCGHLGGKQVIPLEDMVQKIRAAVDAREDPDFIIIGRTDANGVLGFAEALRRAQAYYEAGADMLLIEAPKSLEEIQKIAETFQGVPLVFNWVESGKTPLLPLEKIQQLGFKVIIFSVSLLFAATHNILALLDLLKRGETSAAFAEHMVSFSQFTKHIGLAEIEALERRYSSV